MTLILTLKTNPKITVFRCGFEVLKFFAKMLILSADKDLSKIVSWQRTSKSQNLRIALVRGDLKFETLGLELG
jgi:hypothetical protein